MIQPHSPNHGAALSALAEHFNQGAAAAFVQRSVWNLAVEKKQQAKRRRQEEKKSFQGYPDNCVKAAIVASRRKHL